MAPIFSRPVPDSIRNDHTLSPHTHLRTVLDYYLHLSRAPYLPLVPPPTITARAAWEVPDLNAPWDSSERLRTYVLQDAAIAMASRTFRGTAVVLLEEFPELPPIPEQPTDAPPSNDRRDAASAPTATLTDVAIPPENATVGALSLAKPPNCVATMLRLPLPPPPPARPILFRESVRDEDASLAKIRRSPTLTRHESTQRTTAETNAGELPAARNALSDAVDDALQRLELLVRDHPDLECPRRKTPLQASPLGNAPRVVTPTAEGTCALGDLQYPATDEETDELRDDTPGSPLRTPPTPPPTISPLHSTSPSPKPLFGSVVSYDLRPRPRPLPRRYQVISPPGTIKKPRRYAPRRRREKDALDRPDLALQALERRSLNSLLDVPARLWTKHERRFLKTVTRSLRRATEGGIGYGEPAKSNGDEMDID
ncbi:hypothetical protein FKP32DRAFT_1601910 [Trametes sanguinea]|nr:hypothetical protein FKP32DRAFT_1601910 [Trametes sanguinea]